MSLPWLDIVLIAVMLVSGLLAMMRGFNREALTVFAWGGALVAAWVMLPVLQEPIREKISPNQLADIIAFAGVFISVLVIISIIAMRFADVVLDSRVGALDRTLGFIFGVVRGFVLVAIAYLFLDWFAPKTQPTWISEARSRPMLKETGEFIASLLPDDIVENLKSDPDDGTDSGTASPPKPEPGVIPESNNTDGYERKERQGLNQLLESSSGNQ